MKNAIIITVERIIYCKTVYDYSIKKVYILGYYVRHLVNASLLAILAYLSVPVVQNLFSSRQRMNTSFEPLRIVNTYGAFGRFGNGPRKP